MLSLMHQNNEKSDEFERNGDDDSDFTERQDQREKETVQYMRYIRDRGLLTKMVRLRKIIQYFLASSDHSDIQNQDVFKQQDDVDTVAASVTSNIDSNINSFFR